MRALGGADGTETHMAFEAPCLDAAMLADACRAASPDPGHRALLDNIARAAGGLRRPAVPLGVGLVSDGVGPRELLLTNGH